MNTQPSWLGGSPLCSCVAPTANTLINVLSSLEEGLRAGQALHECSCSWGALDAALLTATFELMGFRTRYPRNLAPWDVEYLKLKEFEEAEAGRAL